MTITNQAKVIPAFGERATTSLHSLSAWLFEKLSRVTTTGEIIREIDGFRFLAIASVILHHTLAIYLESTHRLGVQGRVQWQLVIDQSYLVRFLRPGWFGVQLFFIISGFVLGLPFARRHLCAAPAPTLKSYYLRRVTR